MEMDNLKAFFNSIKSRPKHGFDVTACMPVYNPSHVHPLYTTVGEASDSMTTLT